ncbi:MAG TPA: hypothetical protein PKD55_25830, partial [Bellilinea sp.]|nr:hypothetical protein [Bellilinea sp.]
MHRQQRLTPRARGAESSVKVKGANAPLLRRLDLRRRVRHASAQWTTPAQPHITAPTCHGTNSASPKPR